MIEEEEEEQENQGSSDSAKVAEEKEIKEYVNELDEEAGEKEDSALGRSTEERERKSKAEMDSRKAAAGFGAVRTPTSTPQQVPAPAPCNLADKSTWTRRKVCAVKRTRFRTRIAEEKLPEKSPTKIWPSPQQPPHQESRAAFEVAAGSAASTANAADSGDSDVVVTSVKDGKRTKGDGGSRKSARLDARARK